MLQLWMTGRVRVIAGNASDLAAAQATQAGIGISPLNKTSYKKPFGSRDVFRRATVALVKPYTLWGAPGSSFGAKEDYYPISWPGPNNKVGSCISHAMYRQTRAGVQLMGCAARSTRLCLESTCKCMASCTCLSTLLMCCQACQQNNGRTRPWGLVLSPLHTVKAQEGHLSNTVRAQNASAFWELLGAMTAVSPPQDPAQAALLANFSSVGLSTKWVLSCAMGPSQVLMRQQGGPHCPILAHDLSTLEQYSLQ